MADVMVVDDRLSRRATREGSNDWSWTQAEFLCSGHYMPSTPEGAPLSQHASFLPPDDDFELGADEPQTPCKVPSKPRLAAKERATTTSSEWHVFGGGVPLVRQHSQELQSMVQTAFDEMEAVLASGRTGRTPPLRPRTTRILSGSERRELNLPSAPCDDRERSVHAQRQSEDHGARDLDS